MDTRHPQRNTISLPFGLSETLSEPIAIANQFIVKLEKFTEVSLPTFEEVKAFSTPIAFSPPSVRSKSDIRPAVLISPQIQRFETPYINTANVSNPHHRKGTLRGYVEYTISV